MSVDIAYIVSHGFAARMVMQTNLLGRLVSKGNKVALVSPDASDKNLMTYCKENQVELVSFNESSKLSHQNYIFKRKYYLEDLKANPALWEKHIYSTRYNRSLNPFSHIWPRYYGIIYRLIPFFPSIRSGFIKDEHKNLESKAAESLINTLKPKKLVATYPINFNEATLLYHANKRKDVETWIHLLSWDNITSKGYFPQLADKYIAWGPIMKEELKEVYQVQDENIFECGVPHFDLHAQVGANPNFKPVVKDLGLNPEQPYLFFAMSSPRFAPREIDIVEWMAKQVEKGGFGEGVQLIIRPHPQNMEGAMKDKSWFARLKRMCYRRNVAVDFPSLVKSKLNWSMQTGDMIRLSQLIAGASVTFNSGSTVSIDALVHDRPVIITAFDGDQKLPYWRSARRLIDYVHLRKLVDLGGVRVARSYEDLATMTALFLKQPMADMEKRSYTVQKEVGDFVGSATQKACDVLTEVTTHE